MIIKEIKCFSRHCKYFKGVVQSDGTERTENVACVAFPKGIPSEISVGNNEHLKPLPDQDNEIVFEKGKFEWED